MKQLQPQHKHHSPRRFVDRLLQFPSRWLMLAVMQAMIYSTAAPSVIAHRARSQAAQVASPCSAVRSYYVRRLGPPGFGARSESRTVVFAWHHGRVIGGSVGPLEDIAPKSLLLLSPLSFYLDISSCPPLREASSTPSGLKASACPRSLGSESMGDLIIQCLYTTLVRHSNHVAAKPARLHDEGLRSSSPAGHRHSLPIQHSGGASLRGGHQEPHGSGSSWLATRYESLSPVLTPLSSHVR